MGTARSDHVWFASDATRTCWDQGNDANAMRENADSGEISFHQQNILYMLPSADAPAPLARSGPSKPTECRTVLYTSALHTYSAM